MRMYSSFDEIDNDLSILKLEKDIALEKIKLNLTKTKNELQLVTVLAGFGDILKKTAISLLIKRFLK